MTHPLELVFAGKPRQALGPLYKLADSGSYTDLVNLAVGLRACGELAESEEIVKRAAALDQTRPEAWNNFAQIATDLGQFDRACCLFTTAYARAVEARARNLVGIEAVQQTALGYAYSLMRLKRFAQAWPLFELGRFGVSWTNPPGTQPWTGQDGVTVLVVCEGGYGDAMLFGRWLPVLAKRCKVRLLIWDKLTAWRDWKAVGVEEVHAYGKPLEVGEDWHATSWMSLPGLLGMKTVEDIPTDSIDGWDHPYANDTVPTGRRVDRTTPRIGYCWTAEENGSIRRVRSLAHDDAIRLAKRLRSFGEVHSLSPSDQGLHGSKRPTALQGVRYEYPIATWEATTETIRRMDFVVTVDTAVAHLAGLVGVPTLVLLPMRSDWKWHVNTDTSVWYGPALTLYRSPRPVGWDIDGIVAAVERRLS